MDDFGTDYGLVFDRASILETCQKLSGDLSGYRVHFSVKSFPESEFLKIIADFVHGWDLSSARELDLVLPLLLPTHSLWLTNSDAELLECCAATRAPLFFTLDHTSSLSLIYPESVSLGVRLDPLSLLGRGHSRYGFTLNQLGAISDELKRRIKFLHCHCPGIISAAELSGIRSAIEHILPQFPNVSLVNLGGGLTPGNFDAYEMLPQIYTKPNLAIEPGRWFSESAGSAFCRIQTIFEKNGDLYLVGDLSPQAHMKWAREMKFTFVGLGQLKKYHCKRLIYSSSNALESDQLILSSSDTVISLAEGGWLVFDKIPGYSVAWNHEFNGIPKAPVFFID